MNHTRIIYRVRAGITVSTALIAMAKSRFHSIPILLDLCFWFAKLNGQVTGGNLQAFQSAIFHSATQAFKAGEQRCRIWRVPLFC